MKQQDKKQYAGVWLDNKEAVIISAGEDAQTADYAISNKIAAAKHKGGGSEHSMNNAIKSDQLKYFKELALMLMPYDEILIFGPGQSQEQMQNYLQDNSQFNHKKITIDSSDQLTDSQRVAKVREFFKGHQS